MSKEAIQAVMQELELLPETDQRLVLTFLAKLRRNRLTPGTPASETRAALQPKGGLLVFTGQLEQPDTDWVQLVREERDEDVINSAAGRPSHS